MNILKAAALAAAISLGSLGATVAQAANIVETAASVGTFKTLLAAAKAAGLAEALSTTDNITVFAPTDAAFAALPAGTVEDLLKPENKDKLVAILTMHVLPRVLMSNQLLSKPFHVKTLNPGERLTISAKSSGVTVSGSNTAKVVQADVKADNGVIHVIDTVLLP
ncbi:MAG: fasciclin domain-containing protein [Devosia sp.]|uniref:fasciclin domain-containing protein n=1 Tax=Devosia sp. TaxID=1871048 RepID=UPI001ACE3CA1|nr:fasciclin domain-containing protein [Devosia sp.]MBN9309185.1 fasciclin domain-containing protein [Devosia sp.]MBN9315869.1 fasciclin domain-containing protein [Devosia sp.]